MRKPRKAPGPPSTAPDAPRRRRLKPSLLAGAALLGVLAGLGVVAYGFRGPIGVKLAVNYLEGRGVPAEIAIDRLDLGGFSGSLRLGPREAPDLTVERIEVEFEPIPFLTRGLAAPRLRSVRLVRPKLRVAWRDGKPNFGTLQPMVDEILAQPLVEPGPSARIEQGEARITTPYGPAVVTGEAIIDQGRIRRAVGHLAATRIALPSGLALQLDGADFDVQGRADRLTAEATASLVGVTGGPATLGRTRARIEASLPYASNAFDRLDGPVAAALTAEAATASGQGVEAKAAKLDLRFGGTAAGPTGDLALALSGEGSAAAETVTGPGGAEASKASLVFKAARLDLRHGARGERIAAGGVTLAVAADRAAQGEVAVTKAAADLALDSLKAEADAKRWTLAAPLKLKASAGRLDAPAADGRLTLPALVLTASGDADLASDQPPAIALAGSASSGRGGLDRRTAAALAKAAAVVADEARAREALAAFRFDAPAWRLTMGPGGAAVGLVQPATIQAAGGVQASLSGAGGGPLLETAANGAGSGGAAFRLAGAGLPRLSVSAPAYSLSADGRLRADLTLDVGLDSALLEQASLKGSGRLDASAAGLSFTPRGCLEAAAASAGEGAAAQDVAARICGEGSRPLFALTEAGWRADGRVEGGRAGLPAAAVSAQDAAIRFTLRGTGERPAGQLSLAKVRIADAAAPRRFLPLDLSGDFALGAEALTGQATVRDAGKGVALVTAAIRQSVSGPSGSADIVSELAFARGGLQPADLSPLARNLASNVDAKLRFTGKAAWSDKGLVSSSGRLTTTGAALKTPFGQVVGAAADIALTSLMPPLAPAGQTVSAERIVWAVPLTNAKAVFGLDAEALTLAEADATVAKGKVSLGGLRAPLAGDRRLTGVLRIDGVDVGELLKASSFSDSVTMQASINGALPFSVSPEGVRLTNGVLMSVGPGRLSIKRQALTGAVATAGAEGAQPNAVQDFAYQALENLAFDSLDAKVDSRPEGRLGAVFHLVGRNDPPGDPKARVAVTDLIQGRAFDKPIPLPKNTPVDLTLDTSLNFDELLKAYGEAGLGGSAAVQPQGR